MNLTFDPTYIPEHLKTQNRWIQWHPVGDKAAKIPVIVGTATNAKTDDPSTWSNFETLLNNSLRQGFGAAYVIYEGDDVIFIDLDHVLTTEGLVSWAVPYVDMLAQVSYIEVSPSGTGLHIITRTSSPLPEHVSKIKIVDNQGIEIYGGKYGGSRYMTMTGNVWRENDYLTTTTEGGVAVVEVLTKAGMLGKAKTYSAPTVSINSVPTAEKMRQARSYLKNIPGAVEGQHGDDLTFRAACKIARGFDLSDADSMELMQEWNASCSPPWSEEELLKKISNAKKSGDEPLGGRIEAPINPVDEFRAAGFINDIPVPAKPKRENFCAGAKTLGEFNWLHIPAPAIVSLLDEPIQDPNDPMMTKLQSVLASGTAGMLVAAGGSGKSYLFLQLAIAVAVGLDWIGLRVAHPGRVVIAMAEEKDDDIHRRIEHIGRALKLTAEQMKLADQNIVIIPCRGQDTALTLPMGKEIPTGLPLAPAYYELSEYLKATEGECGYRLILLDPLSRFGGAGTEESNPWATRFVQVVEKLSMAIKGEPTVLVAHHTNKLSRKEEQLSGGTTSAMAASAARGATGLTDGFRWQAGVEPLAEIAGMPEMVVFRITKVNNVHKLSTVDQVLIRDMATGVMRMATEGEIAARMMAISEQKDAQADQKKQIGQQSLQDKIMAAISNAGGKLSGSKIEATLGGAKGAIGLALDCLIQTGVLTEEGHKKSPKHLYVKVGPCVTSPTSPTSPGEVGEVLSTPSPLPLF